MNFDRFAQDYRAEVDKAAGVLVERLAGEKSRLILDVLSTHRGDPKRLRVLDIGCGIGLVDCDLEGEVGFLCGADMSQRSLDLARARAPATRFALYDGVSLPLRRCFIRCSFRHIRGASRATGCADYLHGRDAAAGRASRHRHRHRAQPAQSRHAPHRLALCLRCQAIANE